jgi:dTMP kinase
LVHDLREALDRAVKDGADRLESESLDFHAQVREGFERIAQMEPQRVRLVTSRARKSETAAAVFAELADLFPAAAELPFVIDDALIEQIKKERG